MKIFLIRHAQSQANVNKHLVGGRSSATPLSKEGVLQAVRLGHAFDKLNLKPTQVISSPAVRTQETARLSLEPIPQAPSIRINDALQEMSQGVFEGQPRDQVYTAAIQAQIESQGKDFSLPDDSAESMNDVAHRMDTFLQHLTTTMQRDDVAFVYTHGIAICCYVGMLLGLSQQEVFARTRALPNASYTELSVTEPDHIPEILSFGTV